MVKSNRYTPTNKAFRNKFQEFASTKTKKGHLNGSDETEGAKKLNGVLVKINRQKLYDKGWLVKTTDDKEYWCSYGDGVVCIPESVVSKEYYVPKKTTEVEISVDEDNSIYTITRLKDPNKKPIALYNDIVEISTNTNTNTNSDVDAKIQVSANDIKLLGQTLAKNFSANNISVEKNLNTNTVTANDISSNGTIDATTIKVEQLVLEGESVANILKNIEERLKRIEEGN